MNGTSPAVWQAVHSAYEKLADDNAAILRKLDELKVASEVRVHRHAMPTGTGNLKRTFVTQ